METKIEVVISSPDEHKIFPEAGETEEDWKGKEKELKEFRKEYSEEVHNFLVKRLKNYVSEPEGLEDDFFEHAEEARVDGWDEFSDYGVDIKVNLKGDFDKEEM